MKNTKVTTRLMFCDVAPCSLLKSTDVLVGHAALSSQLRIAEYKSDVKIVVGSFPETSLNYYQTTSCNIRKASIVQSLP